MKLLLKKRKNIEDNLVDLGYGDDFLDIIQKAQSMKEVVDKLDFTKITNTFNLQKT